MLPLTVEVGAFASSAAVRKLFGELLEHTCLPRVTVSPAAKRVSLDSDCEHIVRTEQVPSSPPRPFADTHLQLARAKQGRGHFLARAIVMSQRCVVHMRRSCTIFASFYPKMKCSDWGTLVANTLKHFSRPVHVQYCFFRQLAANLQPHLA